MHAEPGVRTAAPRATVLTRSAAFVLVALSITGVLTVFWPTTLSMVEIWRRTETFQHCFTVFPISLWLIWGERERLARSEAKPWWPGVALIALLGFVWLLGALGAAQFVSQAALIGLACAFVLTVFGVGWARILWFPLLFMFFAVPFGEALVPLLMDWTADVTIAALRASGVPVYREGVHFVIPSGQWSVVEACSGIKFLIASIMAGALYAWLMYRSTGKRAAFMAASIIVPILANWLRAYSIVMIGHLSSNRLMTHDDHIVFGWVLFGTIMLMMYWIGARWREDLGASLDLSAAAAIPLRLNSTAGRRLGGALVVATVVVAIWPMLSRELLEPGRDRPPLRFAAPEPRAGWVASAEPLNDWQPVLPGSPERWQFTFRQGGSTVGLFVAGYATQEQDSQVASTGNQLVDMAKVHWKQTTRGSASTGGALGVPESARSATLQPYGRADQFVVWHWYWIGDRATTSDLQGKLRLALARLTRQSDAGLWIAISVKAERNPTEASAVLRAFVADMDASLAQSFRQTVGR